jgi:hypothetical protein
MQSAPCYLSLKSICTLGEVHIAWLGGPQLISAIESCCGDTTSRGVRGSANATSAPAPSYTGGDAIVGAVVVCGTRRFMASGPTPRSASEARASVERHLWCGGPLQCLRLTRLPRQADSTPAGCWRESLLRRPPGKTRPSPPRPPRSVRNCGIAEPTSVDTPEYPHHREKEAAVPLRKRD